MKLLVTNKSKYDEILNDEILSPNESRVFSKESIRVNKLSPVFSVIELKDDTKISEDNVTDVETLGDDTSPEDLIDADSDNINQEDDIGQTKEDYLSTLSKDQLNNIISHYQLECGYSRTSKIVGFIIESLPDTTIEELKEIVEE